MRLGKRVLCIGVRTVSSTFLMRAPPLQCISPGIVETEFAFRHHNSDPEKAAAVYESIKVRVRI